MFFSLEQKTVLGIVTGYKVNMPRSYSKNYTAASIYYYDFD